MPPPAHQIFISYRRRDSGGRTGRLYDNLEERFGAGSVFMDQSDIPGGADFERTIASFIPDSKVVLVVIGPDWHGPVDGGRRIDDPADFVRREVATALAGEALVVPVLVENAPLPAPLPPDLATLTDRQAMSVRDEGWDDDVRRLVAAIEGQVEALPSPDPWAGRRLPPARYLANLGLLLGGLALVGWWFTRHLYDLVTGGALVGGAVAAALVAGALAWSLLKWLLGNPAKSWLNRLLGGASATWMLAGVIVAAAALLLVTSSIHLELGNAAAGGPYEVKVSEAGGAVGTYTLGPQTPLAGTVSFFAGRRAVGLEISEPAGLGPRSYDLAPWGVLRASVPDDFGVLAGVRVVPAPGLYASFPPDDGREYEVAYSLAFELDGQTTAIEEDARKAVTYYLGLTPETVGGLGEEERDGALIERFGAQFGPALVGFWGESPRYLPELVSLADEELEIVVTRVDGASGEAAPVPTSTTRLPRAPGQRLQVLLVEPEDG